MSVTCVMPTTASRHHFWFPAIRCFMSQTCQDAQLLILDESPAPALGDFGDERIIYRWMPDRGLKLGRKRNEINVLVETDVVCHFDDDDWYHPEYVERQLGFMELSGKAVIGYSGLLYLKVPERTLWKYRYQGKGHYACGASLCYTREFWQQHPFPEDRSIGEDTALWNDAVNADAIASRGDEGMIVARCHGANTFKPSFGQAPFLPAVREDFPEEFLREAGL